MQSADYDARELAARVWDECTDAHHVYAVTLGLALAHPPNPYRVTPPVEQEADQPTGALTDGEREAIWTAVAEDSWRRSLTEPPLATFAAVESILAGRDIPPALPAPERDRAAEVEAAEDRAEQAAYDAARERS
jgi:hypothetical protein